MTLSERDKRVFFDTYSRIPLEIEYGEGVYLFDKNGKRYLDMFAGLAVNSLGYSYPPIIKAIETQCKKYIHLSNYYYQGPQIELAELLVHYSGYSKVFFTNSGTEATDGAIKIARKWGGRFLKNEIISFTNAFHGRTITALSMMDRQKHRNGYEPFLENFKIIEFNNSEQLTKSVNHKTLAVVLEFIQGEGGIIPASNEFVNTIRELQHRYKFLVIADEIQSGLGRTGKMFAFQHFNIQPDIVLIAKPLGGGLPLGAILGNETVANILEPGTHGSTFGGNPVACAAGIVVLREIFECPIMNNAKVMGDIFKKKLVELQCEFPKLIKDVRGLGLMLGVELYKDGDMLVSLMREKGILINCLNHKILRFLPPLIITEEHIIETINALREAFVTYS